jgi:hypothetical protein
MTSYSETINELEKQVNDFSKYIKPEELNTIKNDHHEKHNTNIIDKDNGMLKSLKINNKNLKYIAIPVITFVFLYIVKPSFIMSEKVVDEKKVKTINYINLLIITIVISIIIYLLIKKFLKT